MRRTVVLPAPFGPRKPYISPFETARSIPSTALTLPKCRVRPSASTASSFNVPFLRFVGNPPMLARARGPGVVGDYLENVCPFRIILFHPYLSGGTPGRTMERQVFDSAWLNRGHCWSQRDTGLSPHPSYERLAEGDPWYCRGVVTKARIAQAYYFPQGPVEVTQPLPLRVYGTKASPRVEARLRGYGGLARRQVTATGLSQGC